MKTVRAIPILLAVLLAALSGCAAPTAVPRLEADQVTIGLALSSYLYVSDASASDRSIVAELVDDWNRMTTEPVVTGMDVPTMYSVTFLKAGRTVASLTIDENGTMRIGDEEETYRQATTTLRPERVAEIFAEHRPK